MNSIFAVWSLSEKHSIYIELLFQELLLSSRLQECSLSLSHILILIRAIEHRKHSWASKAFFQKCSLSLSYPLLYILTRIIEHRESSRKPCHPRGLDLPLIQDGRAYPTTTSTCYVHFMMTFHDTLWQALCIFQMSSVWRLSSDRRRHDAYLIKIA